MAERSGTRVRLIDVAQKAGVSLTTASFAMSGRPGVSEPVAARVRAIAAELGYVPNMQARSLASGASSTIGVVVHDLADPYFAELAASVVRSANDLGFMVQICQSSRDASHELREVRNLVANRVRAIIMAGSSHLNSPGQNETYDELRRFEATGGRVALIGRHPVSIDAVIVDNVPMGRLMGEHFLELGHREVGIASGPADLAAAADRLSGVQEAFAHAKAVAHVRHSSFTHEGGRQATHDLLAEHPDITGIIALNDAMAGGVLTALRELSRPVPDDISVSGFDDVAVAANLGPGLTTIHLPLDEMGAGALELSLKPAAARARRRVIQGRIAVRGSTAPPRSGASSHR